MQGRVDPIIDLLPLPIIWLAFFVLGLLTAGRSIMVRRYLAALVSGALLLATTSWQTTGFYVALSLSVVVVGALLCRIGRPWLRYAVFVLSLAVIVLVLLAYMAGRTYVQKYFVYLPSLSYLSFRAIALLVTVYRRRELEFSAGLTQMVFFPMLFTGPISRVENFEESKWDYGDVLRRLALGFGMLIAAELVNPYVLTDKKSLAGATCWEYWIGLFANSFELYFSFSGWTHLIIGLGLLLGFKLPENFNLPYLATSISEFWRRWHMSLSFWIRDYLYIPLGGNRKGLPRKCANLMVAMALCGLWHGLALHYLVWGLFHGLLLAIESLMAAYDLQPVKRVLPGAYRPIKIVSTFMLVSFSWLLFRYSIPAVLTYARGLMPW